jgi:5,10-methylenetetrahydromethanopterin reductase
MDFGIALAPGVDAWKTVRRAEELGFSHAWLYDTQLLCADVFVAMALAAEHTSRIMLGPGVLIPTNRIAPVAANGLASLNRLAPGRIILGIGTGFTARLTMGLGPMKLSDLKEYVRVVRAMLRDETVAWTHEGLERKIRFLNPEKGLIDTSHPIPVHLSAFAPKARAYAATECDGWMNFVSALPMALYEIGEINTSCKGAGRDPQTLYKTGFTLGCVLEPGEDAGSPRARAQAGPLGAVFFHGVIEGAISLDRLPPELQSATEAYRRNVYERYEPADARYLALHTGHLMWVRPEEEPFITKELLAATTFTGNRDELVERVRMLRDAGYQQLAVQLVPGHESAMEDWIEVFQRA